MTASTCRGLCRPARRPACRPDVPAASVVELAHLVDEPALPGPSRRAPGPGRRAPGPGRRALRPARRSTLRATFHLSRPHEELPEAALRLEVAPDHDRVVRLERLGDAIHERAREAERVANLADGGARPVRDEVAHHPRVLGPVGLVDVLDDLLPALGREVDVDVRIRRPAFVDEALEEQVVADRVDAGDAQDVGHDRVGRAAPALRRNAALTGEAHQVPADQEELGEAGLLDDRQLVGELPDDRRGHRVVAPTRAFVTEALEIRERRVAIGYRKAREAVLLETELDRAFGRKLAGIPDALRPGAGRRGIARRGGLVARWQGRELLGRLQVLLA